MANAAEYSGPHLLGATTPKLPGMTLVHACPKPSAPRLPTSWELLRKPCYPKKFLLYSLPCSPEPTLESPRPRPLSPRHLRQGGLAGPGARRKERSLPRLCATT